MQIYYQLQYENIGIKQTKKLINKIIEVEESPMLMLKYKFSLPLYYYFSNDESAALEPAKDVIETLEAPSTAIVPSEIFDYFVLSDIYSFFSQMTNDSKYTNKAIEYLMEIKDQDGLSIKGKALTRTQIGYNYFLLHNYTEAIKFLLDSHEYEVTQISMVYLAESYLEIGFEQEAKEILYKFSFDDIKEIFT